MACANCGHSTRHLNGCGTYLPLVGWCECPEYFPDITPREAPAFHVKGRANAMKMLHDTQAFRDKSVADAAAKARKREPNRLRKYL